jgi:hypothetical protein
MAMLLCAHCEEEFDEETGGSVKLHTDEVYCPTCSEERTFRCADCREYFDKENENYGQDTNGDYVCESCSEDYSRCEHCENICNNDAMCRDPSDNYLCESCWDDRCTNCHGCEDTIWQREALNDGDYNYCENCYPGDNEDDDLHGHDYKPSPIFQFDNPVEAKTTKLFFGVELETECSGKYRNRNAVVEMINETNELFYCKEDSSLSYGVEIVTHPMSWEYIQRKETQETFNGLLKDLVKLHVKSYDTKTCGIHIHMSRAAFTKLHLYKFARFIYGHKAFMECIAQRKATHYARFDTRNTALAAIICGVQNMAGGRYCALNTENRTTVELRVFKGTLNQGSFWKNLEFCKALYEFTKEAPLLWFKVDKKTTNWDQRNYGRVLCKFLEYIASRQVEYPNLYAYLKTKEFFVEQPVKQIDLFDQRATKISIVGQQILTVLNMTTAGINNPNPFLADCSGQYEILFDQPDQGE